MKFDLSLYFALTNDVLSFITGGFLAAIGCMSLTQSHEDDYHVSRFIIVYLIGFVMAFGGTFFMVGFKKQIKEMFGEERRWATISLIATLGCIFVLGIWLENAWLCLFLMLGQWGSIFWYVLPVIPYFRKICCCCCKYCKKGAMKAAEGGAAGL